MMFIMMTENFAVCLAVCILLEEYLESLRWTSALVQAGVVSSSTADSYLKVSHLVRTRHAHQLSE